jgi:hypothetical protein
MLAAISPELWISTVAATASAFGLFFLAVQTRFQTRLAKAQFVNQLSSYVDRNIDLETQMEEGGRLCQEVEALGEADRRAIIMFLNFFDQMYHLIRLGVVPLAILNPLFAYRFFLLVHNPNVQRFELLHPQTRHFWTSIFCLHKMWYAYRIRRGEMILRPEGAARLRDDTVYKNCKR